MTKIPSLSSLQKRILSGLILAPLVIAILYYGGIFFYAFLALGFVISAYELFTLSKGHQKHAVILPATLIYIIMAYTGFYWLHDESNLLAITVMVMVWFSDIGAYVAGKILKGPKLLPKISPNKTWAGFIGALVFTLIPLIFYTSVQQTCHEVMGDCFPVYNGIKDYSFIVIGGLVFGIVCQAGDLLISYLKRQVGAKDTGALIPGHGGILDRIDSLVLISVFAFFFFLPEMLKAL